MADRSFLTLEYVRQCVDYDTQTGAITWRQRPIEHFAKEWRWRTWNTEHAGKPAFSALHTTGYLKGYVNNVRFMAHQIAWVWSHGAWPVGEIDHINGNRCDNRLANLRDVSSIENGRNTRLSLMNKSGCVGVHWDESGKRWRAAINNGERQIWLGSFKDKEAAIAARKAAEIELGYHPNHGRSG